MKEDTILAYKNALSYTNLLKSNLNPNDLPLIDQIEYSFYLLANKDERKKGYVKNKYWMNRRIIDELLAELLNNEMLKNIKMEIDRSFNINSGIEYVYDAMSCIIDAIKYLGIESDVEFYFKNNGIVIDGTVSKKILSRDPSFLKTLQIRALENNLYFFLKHVSLEKNWITLELNWELDSDKFFCIDSKVCECTFVLNEFYYHLLLSKKEFIQLKNHNCVLIKNFDEQEIIESSYLNKSQEELSIIHFPFLFRPISVIIPGRSILYPMIQCDSIVKHLGGDFENSEYLGMDNGQPYFKINMLQFFK